MGVKIAPEGKSRSSSPLFKIEKLSIDPTFEVTTNASLALVESLRIKLFRCYVILILYLTPSPVIESPSLVNGSKWFIFALIVVELTDWSRK